MTDSLKEPQAEKTSSRSALFRIGMLQLLLLAAMIVVPSLLLPFRVPVSSLTFALSVGAALAVYFGLMGANRITVRDMFITAGIVALALILASFLLDTSYDGLTYHKSAIGALKNGWNPYVESVDDWATAQPLRNGLSHYGLWVDHYPRGTWCIGANFYAVTGSIESGKAFNLLSMSALFFLLSDFLHRRGLKNWQSWLIALLAAVNPISLAQFLTYYNDAFLMMALLIMVVLLTDLFYDMRRETFVLLFAALVLATNVKFTGLAYAFVFCFAYLVLLILWRTQRRKKLRGLLLAGAVIMVGTLALLVVGGPYLSNLQEHGHPLYPLMGEGSIAIISDSEPASFNGMPTVMKNFYSLFSYSENLVEYTIADPQLRIPFTLAPNELQTLDVPDLRIGGFGPFFGPILIIAVLIIVIFLFRYSRKNKRVFFILLLNGAVIVGLMLMITESWWARYSGYLYGAVLVALTLLFRYANRPKRKLLTITALLFAALVTMNAAMFFPVGRLQRNGQYREEMDFLKAVSIENDLTIYVGDGTSQFTGLVDNLKDHGIWFRLSPEKQENLAPAMDGILHYSVEHPPADQSAE